MKVIDADCLIALVLLCKDRVEPLDLNALKEDMAKVAPDVSFDVSAGSVTLALDQWPNLFSSRQDDSIVPGPRRMDWNLFESTFLWRVPIESRESLVAAATRRFGEVRTGAVDLKPTPKTFLGKFVVKRASHGGLSVEDNRPTEGAVLEEFFQVDRRSWRTLEEARRSWCGDEFFSSGTDHREEFGEVCRTVGTRKRWTVELRTVEELEKFMVKNRCVIFEVDTDGLEPMWKLLIYDDFLE